MRERYEQVLRACSYLLIELFSALATLLALPILVVGVLSVAVGGVGLVAFPRMVVGLRQWSDWNRGRAAALLGLPHAPRRIRLPEGVREQWRHVTKDKEIHRDLRWIPREVLLGVPLGTLGLVAAGAVVLTVPAMLLWWVAPADDPSTMLGISVTSWTSSLVTGTGQLILGCAVTWWALPWLATWHAKSTLRALRPSTEEELAARVGELTESRAEVLDAHGAELRRIERDLHDGTQARLVAIAMRLGVAKEALGDASGAVARLIQEAHTGTEEAMTELRNVIRTMYPPILADRGLEGALAALAAQSAIPTDLRIDGLARLPAAIEAAAYHIVAETTTNAAKYSGASRVIVRMGMDDGRLVIEVTDDGHGGVDETRGTGVIGIRRRAAALDGTTTVSSPPGGPTVITVELPCAS
ncbi:sensor histidine kinase [Spongiactinospora sp. 9N601]|uniref:sensor histidine kinase n=1 Tax=Spongiactinospora sp. 9N601 TaxID=3375149 RepID=UPI00379A77AA